MRPNRDSNLPDYTVIVDEVSGGEIANLLRGYIVIGEEKIRFMGIAYGRYGGQNVAPRFSTVAKRKIKKIFGDVEKFELDLQLKLVSGDLQIKPRREQSAKS